MIADASIWRVPVSFSSVSGQGWLWPSAIIAPYFAPAARWGQKMGDALLVDGLNGALTDPFGGGLMGVTAENVAERHGIDRARQDAYAVESHRRAAQAIAEGRFASQVLPIEVRAGKATKTFDTDEHVRGDTKPEDQGSERKGVA